MVLWCKQWVIYADDVNLGVKAYTQYVSSIHCKETGLEVNVEKAVDLEWIEW